MLVSTVAVHNYLRVLKYGGMFVHVLHSRSSGRVAIDSGVNTTTLIIALLTVM